jgi:murein DD-endopeptidase MepM/ murein hydrolase activator NlpD
MASRRYTLLLANRNSGNVHRATFSVRPIAAITCFLASLPILIGLGAAWKAKSEVLDLQANRTTLTIENANYRQATAALAGQIASLQSAMSDLGARSALDPTLARAMESLPAVVKSQAMGGTSEVERSAQDALAVISNPEDTFGLLRTILTSLESRLSVVSSAVDRRNALADATPSLWPAHGWITSTMGMRKDPVTGAPAYHRGLDIGVEKGKPVFATAAGEVTFSGYSGNYGNLIVIDHGFGLRTRYGHLLASTVKVGQQVLRGATIGKVGATGRATGYHLHYEVIANGRRLNPLQLLTQKPEAR